MKSDSKQAYKAAGVDLDAAQKAKELIKPLARSTFTPGVVGDIGFFGGLYQLKGYKDPVLVSSTDGVGTKLKIASLAGKLDTVGIDIVNHCINDIFVCGADPLFFLDYIGLGKMVPDQVESLVKGMAKACKESGCALIGGETAAMPGLYAPGDFDLVGFIVGAVERKQIIDGSKIAVGDAILALSSSGLHTNGYSLVRKVFKIEEDPSILDRVFDELGRPLGEALLEPHRCYYPILKAVLPRIKGMAHITGGGLLENIPRVLPKGVAANLDKSAWEVPPLFKLIQGQGKIEDDEMVRVFNMGIGMLVFCDPADARAISEKVPEAELVGMVVPREDGAQVILGSSAI